MFGGFSSAPRKPGDPVQKPLGVIGNPNVPPAQKPLGVISAPSDALGRVQKPLGVLPSAFDLNTPFEVPGNGLSASQVEAEWTGIFHGWSGYAKAGRELIRRAAVFSKIRISDQSAWDPKEPDHDIQVLYKFHRSFQVSARAPRITFMPPRVADEAGYRVIYTMMETANRVHPDMVRLMNERYDECWTPTHWNSRTFVDSGLQIPVFVMPLGVDPGIYSSNVQPAMRPCIRLTGKAAGKLEEPKGFLYISVFQPSFRKGYDVLIRSFEEAFARDPDVGLVLGTTSYKLPDEFPWRDMKSRIWAMHGIYSEKELASAYKACQCYVTTSRGEGWALGVTEAAAMGLPLIVPRTSVFPELVPPDCGYFFDKDSEHSFPGSEKVSPWFGDGMVFPDYGKRSQKQFIALMKHVRENYPEAQERAAKMRAHVNWKYTWGIAARKVAERIRAICARP